MSKTTLDQFALQAIKDVAIRMMMAAKTAPKGRGIERLHYLLIDGAEMMQLADTMRNLSEKHQIPFLARDAGNVEKSGAMLIIGSSNEPRHVPMCSHCGFGCSAKPENTPCAITQADLGIALGSAVSVAAFNHIDNRIMYSAGIAAIDLGWFPQGVTIAYGIPLSVSEKSIFFDRQ